LIRIGIIGYGYWGPNLVRNFSGNKEFKVVAVSDLSEERLALVKERHPGVDITTDHQKLLKDPNIDAIAIATPVSTHYKLALQSLQHGKHVFVEKPLTGITTQAEELVEEAEKRNLVLHVDHTFVYTGAVRKICELVKGGNLGDLYYYDSVRVNLGLFQADVNVIWDLAVHDLSILAAIYPHEPVAVSATGMSHVQGKPANIAFLTIFYNTNMIAHIHVNWLAPVKVRRTLIGGSQKMIVYDDMEQSEKIKVYDKGITLQDDKEAMYKNMVGYRSGDMWSPNLDAAEALDFEASHFASCIDRGKTSMTSGKDGLTVVRILEAATESMKNNGHPVELSTIGAK
jgi:predicted dehydrogenase